MDINSVIQESVKSINFEQIVKEAATEKIQAAVKSAVAEQFRSYSDFSKGLEEQIKKELAVDFTKIQLPEYRDFLISSVNNSLALLTNEEQAQEIVKYINTKVIGENRDKIEFSDFWDELTEMVNEGIDEENRDGRFNIQCTKDENSYSSDYFKIRITENEESSFSSRKKENEVIYAAFLNGKIYHMRDNGGILENFSTVTTWFKALKFRQTTINEMSEEEHYFNERDY